MTFKSDKINLSGSLIVPQCDPLPPCVVMIHGSGDQDCDGNINILRSIWQEKGSLLFVMTKEDVEKAKGI